MRLTDKQLDAPIKLTVVRWQDSIHCAYINDHRIAGGKPWAGGTIEKEWDTSLREVIRAFPDLQKALALDYLGRSAVKEFLTTPRAALAQSEDASRKRGE